MLIKSKRSLLIVIAIVVIAILAFRICVKQYNKEPRQTVLTGIMEQRLEKRLLGSWIRRRANNPYTIQFFNNGQVVQSYENPTKEVREYPGTWKVEGDTVVFKDIQGAYRLRVYALTDSLLTLEREDSVILHFDRIR